MEHTPTPWMLDDEGLICRVGSDTPDWIADVCIKNIEADAAFILLACNAHDELIAALQKIIETDATPEFPYEVRHIARAALAKVEPRKLGPADPACPPPGYGC